MSYKTIQLAYDSGVATITLNRPDKRNAISFELIDDLLRALDEVEKSDAIVLILTGAGKAFCSGMDLENLKALIGRLPEQNMEDSQTMVRMFRTLYEFPKVTIAAVNGAAIGVGTTMLAHADLVIAARSARFVMPFTSLGLVPEAASSLLFPRLVGHQRASALLLLGEPMDAETAHEWGFVNQVVPAAELRKRKVAKYVVERPVLEENDDNGFD